MGSKTCHKQYWHDWVLLQKPCQEVRPSVCRQLLDTIGYLLPRTETRWVYSHAFQNGTELLYARV
jgi:hypothetical protein